MKASSVKILVAAAALALAGWGCNGGDNAATTDVKGSSATNTTKSDDSVKGTVKVDGSSTVFPISERMSEDFKKDAPNVDVPVGQAGTGSGMKKFIAGEIDVCDASRPIKESEDKDAKAKGIDYIELPIAYDGLSIIVNPKNTFVDTLTIDELKKIWEPNSKIKMWNEVRSSFPAKPISLYGPATNHGTYEYFAEAVVKDKSKATRQDYQMQQEYNALVQGVAADENALGYVGYAYYDKNKDKLKLVAVDAGKGALKPSVDAIMNGSYVPLSRPLFIYVAKKAADRPEIKKFVEFYLDSSKADVGDVGYVALPDKAYELAKARWTAGTTGSAFMHTKPGDKVEEVLGAPAAPSAPTAPAAKK